MIISTKVWLSLFVDHVATSGGTKGPTRTNVSRRARVHDILNLNVPTFVVHVPDRQTPWLSGLVP